MTAAGQPLLPAFARAQLLDGLTCEGAVRAAALGALGVWQRGAGAARHEGPPVGGSRPARDRSPPAPHAQRANLRAGSARDRACRSCGQASASMSLSSPVLGWTVGSGSSVATVPSRPL